MPGSKAAGQSGGARGTASSTSSHLRRSGRRRSGGDRLTRSRPHTLSVRVRAHGNRRQCDQRRQRRVDRRCRRSRIGVYVHILRELQPRNEVGVIRSRGPERHRNRLRSRICSEKRFAAGPQDKHRCNRSEKQRLNFHVDNLNRFAMLASAEATQGCDPSNKARANVLSRGA